MSTGRSWFEVRVREQLGPDKWVKKSKFFLARGPGDAAAKYKGSGMVIRSAKVNREKVLGVGSFFRLGDELLMDLRKGGGEVLSVGATDATNVPKKDKKRMRRYHEQRKKEAPDQSG